MSSLLLDHYVAEATLFPCDVTCAMLSMQVFNIIGVNYNIQGAAKWCMHISVLTICSILVKPVGSPFGWFTNISTQADILFIVLCDSIS